MPVVPNFFERLTLLRLNLAPGVMLDFLGAQAFRAACAAHRLGVFDALRDGPFTAAELAARIEADLRGTTILLEALVALGYVVRRRGRFANSAMTAKWLPVVGEGIPYFETMVREEWAHLEETVRRGRPPLTGYERMGNDPARWAEFEAGMLALARMTADEVVAKTRLPATARRLIDLGGGHGYYSVAFCRRHPALSATVFDQPAAVPSAERTIGAEKMGERVAIRTGDFWRDDLGSGHDIALLFNVLHGSPPERIAELLERVRGALAVGGRVAILDQLPDRAGSPVAEAVARLQGLTMLNAVDGQAYAYEELARWLAAAGFEQPRRVRLLRAPGFGLVVATKPPPS
jgi:hypothetical protein